MCFGLYDPTRVLTLDGSGITWNWTSDGSSPWLMLSLSGTFNVKNGAAMNFYFDSRTTGTRNAIYMNAGSEINVSDGSSFTIQGVGTSGNSGQGIQLDLAGTANINVTGGSTFLIDGTNRGYVNSPSIYVDNSTFTVQNCTSNASNGGDFTATNSAVVKYLNNAGHGLSASKITLSNHAYVESDHNGLYGVYARSGFQMDGTSTIVVTHNSYDGDYSGLQFSAEVQDGHIESGATVTITDNYCSGLSNKGIVVFDDGVNLTIINNVNDKGSTSKGGGVFNFGNGQLTLPENALIYNNKAVTAADDIYNAKTSTIKISEPSVGQELSTEQNDTNEDQTITNWFYDGANPNYSGKLGDAGKTARWDSHKYVKLYTYNEDTRTITGEIGLKAAYAPATTFTPIDLTMYVGGDGYENVDDSQSSSNGFPEPGYYVTLPEEINNEIQTNGEPVDLS